MTHGTISYETFSSCNDLMLNLCVKCGLKVYCFGLDIFGLNEK